MCKFEYKQCTSNDSKDEEQLNQNEQKVMFLKWITHVTNMKWIKHIIPLINAPFEKHITNIYVQVEACQLNYIKLHHDLYQRIVYVANHVNNYCNTLG